MSGPRTLAIVNPAAGGGAGARIARHLARDLAAGGVSADVVTSPAAGEAARLASAAVEDGYERVIAVGGDGTANEVANGLVGTQVALGLYPIGSGNDFARGLGYPRTRKKLARFLAQARARRIDVGVANGRAFLNASGVGIDGHVAERVVASSRVIGQTLGYFVGALVSIATYEPRAMRVRVGATLREGRHLVVVAANGMYFGNGMRVAPDAKLDDGLLDVIVAGDLGKWESLVALAKIYRGTHVDGRRIVAFRTPAVEIELADELPMQLDGEAMRTRRLDIGLRPRALTVLGR